MSSTLHLAGCVLGVWITWSVHDYLQEKIFRVNGFHFGLFMAFTLQSVSFLLALFTQVVSWLMDSAAASRRAADVAAEEAQRRREEALDEEQEHGLLKEDEEFIMLRLIRIHHDRILPAGPG